MGKNKKSFNYKHSATRVHIERAFGQLKGRFRRLLFVDVVDSEELNALIVACCVVHNICMDYDDHSDDPYHEIDPNSFEGVYANAVDGNDKREKIVQMIAQQ